ncbi:MAG TPA: hypothetical protein VN681_02785 [Stellaceae bacterium]|nr:hypothetical protein [Stellaceae bacterium]
MASAKRDRLPAWARPGSAFMRPLYIGEREMAFASHFFWPALAALPLLPSLYAALHGRRLPVGSRQWLVVIGVAAVFLAVVLLLFLLRESLAIDLERLSYAYRRRHWLSPTTRHGSLHEFQSVALDTLAGRKSGVIWIASLQYMAPDKRITVANFSDGGKAYAFVEDLARRLDLPVLDRTGAEERTTSLSRIDAPLAPRAGLAPPPIDAPPATGIRLTGDAPHRRITLPAMGVNLGVAVIAILPALLVWLAITPLPARQAAAARAAHRHLRPHVAIDPFLWRTTLYVLAGLCVAYLVLLCVARWQIRERGDTIVATSRALGINLRRRRFRKDEILAVELRPSPAGRAMLYDLQIRARRKLLVIGTTLREDGARWLEQSVLAMLEAR